MSVYADTTAIFEHEAGTGISRAAARAALADRQHVATSDHVEREWKRIVVTAASAVDIAARREPDLAAALARLARGYGREPSQRLRVLALCAGDRLDRTEMRLRAQQLVRADADSRLHSVVTEIRRTSQCGLATERPTPLPDGGWALKTTCQRREGICAHEGRIGTDASRWTAGAQALQASDVDALRAMGRLAGEMLAGPVLRTGRNCFGRTGDLAIALDCRSDETLVTTDRSFEVIGPALQLQIHRIPTG